MVSNCLSSASIVRCEALNKSENAAIFIPTFVQLVVLVGLAALYWGSNRRKHFIIIFESCIYLILTLIDLISHLDPAARRSLQVFKVLDVVIGSLSFAPILIYVSFIYFFSRSYCLPLFPRLSSKITKYVILVFGALCLATNELGSFVGVAYRVLKASHQTPTLEVGFKSDDDRTTFFVFTAITLVLLITLQAFIFNFATYLAIRIAQDRRHGSIHRLPIAPFETAPPSVHGMFWVALGSKLGVIETILGFVSGGFAVVMTRRLLRMFSRVFLALGVLQFEPSSSSRSTHSEGRSMSQIRAMISNPQGGSFTRLSPTARNFYTLPRTTSPDVRNEETSPSKPKRVTVRYDGETAPSLDIRLSDLGIPPPEVLAEKFRRRESLIAYRKGSASSINSLAELSPPMSTGLTLPRELEPVARSRDRFPVERAETMPTIRPNPRYYQGQMYQGQMPAMSGHSRIMSRGSIASDSLSIVRNLADQFPGIPPRRTPSDRDRYKDCRPIMEDVDQTNETSRKAEVVRSLSGRRKPPPSDLDFLDLQREPSPENELTSSRGSGESKVSIITSSSKRKNTSLPRIETSTSRQSLIARVRVISGSALSTPQDSPVKRSISATTPGLTTTSGTGGLPSTDTPITSDPFRDTSFALRESEIYNSQSGLGGIAARVADLDRKQREHYRNASGTLSLSDRGVGSKGKGKGRADPQSISPTSPWRLSGSTTNSFIAFRGSSTIEPVRRETLNSSLARIKSVGQVTTRQTPTPSTSSFTRQSMRIEQLEYENLPDAQISIAARSNAVNAGSYENQVSRSGDIYDGPYEERKLRRQSDIEWEM